jgi:Ca-activated chloride channel family protein
VSFASPWFLLALLALPAALGLQYLMRRRQRRHAIRFTGVPTLAGVVPNVSKVRRHIPLGLFLAALAVLAVALAKPERSVGVPVERASVTLVTDVSRSMKADDVDPSRLEAARKAGERFLDQAPPNLRIGSVTFSDTPQIVESPSEDRNEARSVLDGLVADGGTATGDALQAALDTLDEQGARRPPAARTASASPPRSCCSPTASRPSAATPSAWPARRASAACRCSPSRSARRARSSRAPTASCCRCRPIPRR